MEYISYCGLLCNECPVYIATKNNDGEMKARLDNITSRKQS
jgi:hypothetical protein